MLRKIDVHDREGRGKEGKWCGKTIMINEEDDSDIPICFSTPPERFLGFCENESLAMHIDQKKRVE